MNGSSTARAFRREVSIMTYKDHKYKNYYLTNFDGRYDWQLEEVVDHGERLSGEGNWDYILFNNVVYYIDITGSAHCGIFSDINYFNKFRRDQL